MILVHRGGFHRAAWTGCYSCEAWGSYPLNKIEVLQRKAIKMVLDIYSNSANDIVYVESGFSNLKPVIYKRQLKYFQKLRQDCENNPTSSISRIVMQAINAKTLFIRHYLKLDDQFRDNNHCYDFYANEHKTAIRNNIIQKHSTDPNSILGTYFQINPSLESPKFYRDSACQEYDRVIISRYRIGSHKLNIQAGRLQNVNRTERLCKCSLSIQSLNHVLFNCTLTDVIRRTHGIQVNDSLQSFFQKDFITISSTLTAMEKILKIK